MHSHGGVSFLYVLRSILRIFAENKQNNLRITCVIR